MRQLTFVRPGLVEWREAATPALASADAALVRPTVLGRCDLDVGFVRGLAPMAAGEPIGHEMIGEVVDVGDGVRHVRPGQRVIAPSQISCGICRNCRRGFTGRCQTVPFAAGFGMGRPGNYGCAAADLVGVPFADAMLVPLPAGADPVAMIGAADMAADSWRAVAPQLAERSGASVLVMGGLAAVIGIYAAGLAVALGAGRVDYADDDPVRLAQAAAYGATPITLPGDLPMMYEIVVDACGTPETLIQAIRATEPEGLLTSVTIHLRDTTPVPMLDMYHKGIVLRTGRANVRTNIPPTLDCCHAHGFRPNLVETRLYAFDDAPAAWMDDALRTAASRV
ncbi:MAG: alcohol dehydrogenase catalytic domain-containing protein [Sphingomonas sp.]|uniref:alcohol dehydrogenase catalytic domain-containing protein n=1 Tax=Sphingomonas sp. TaxID=28214 RepID=UPI0035A8C365|nr:alcohol dehydrogenase catalytic domain-containing protein [Sphingomonas sp.]